MPLHIFLLGTPHIERDGEAISIRRRKAKALLAYLAMSGLPQSRDTLATLLWPEHDQSRARANLRRELSLLKQALNEEVMIIDRSQVSLDPQADLWLDAAVFQSSLAQAQEHEHDSATRLCDGCLTPLEEAVDLYAGDFMEGFTLSDCPAFDEWQFFQAESLRQALAEVLQKLIQWYTAQGKYEQSIVYGRRWLALDPLHEPAQRWLMRLYALSGQWTAALRQYQECVRLLEKELGIEPEEETTLLSEAIRTRQLVAPEPFEGAAKDTIEEVFEESYADTTSEELSLDDLEPAFLASTDSSGKNDEKGIVGVGLNFVGREQELKRLDEDLSLALDGQGRVTFVIGDAGRGKTVLVQAFAQQAQNKHHELVVAGGNCNAYVGIGDPYLPFREVLELFTGDVEAKWVAGAIDSEHTRRLWRLAPKTTQILLDTGPDLVDVFLPGPPLLTRMQAASPRSADWLKKLESLVERHAAGDSQGVQQSDLFEQYTRVLQALARQQPLLLVLDDLQWADSGSINLLFHLGRRLAGSRIQIFGIYRPDEVAAGRDGERHPLEKVVNEFQRQFGDVIVDLRQADGWTFIEALLDAEPNQLGDEFRAALYQHTRGHALFTTEMLQGLQERRDLVQDEGGHWVAKPSLNWEILPARIEGVIGERIGRLPEAMRESLKIASVEGETFTAEVVARLQGIDEREMVQQLSSNLDRRYRLVRGQGSQRLGEQRLSKYRFRHILFQLYLYNILDAVEQEYLHEAIGNELERLYGQQSEEIAVDLAWHFEQAGLAGKAAEYLYQAGSRAVRLPANEEAIAQFERGLSLLQTLPETTERNRLELALQIALFAPLAGAKGYGAPEVGRAYKRARELCEKIDDPDQLFLVLYGLWGHNLVRSELQTSRQLAAECLSLAEREGKVGFLMEAHRMTDESAFYMGIFDRAHQHFERSLALYDPQEHRAHAEIYGQDPGVALLSHGCCILWHVGLPDQALQRGQEAIVLAQKQEHPFSLGFALCYKAMMHQYRREPSIVLELTEEAIKLSREQGFILWLAQASFLQGWALATQGQTAEGIAQMNQSLADWRATGSEFLTAYNMALLATVQARLGQVEMGLALLKDAFAVAAKKNQGLYEAELYRLKGELLLQYGAAASEIEPYFHQAIEIAQRRHALSQELRAVTSLARLWFGQGKSAKAHALLSKNYDSIEEGFDTADLQEARDLLQLLEVDRRDS